MNDIKDKKNKKTRKKKTKDKKGFTLIELLAVIIILGVLLLIAVPSISKYIENSRKNTYINTIKTMVNSVSTAVNAMELPFALGKNEGMIVPFSEVELEKKTSTKKSPYAPWIPEKSYILVVFDGEMFKYYVSALDEAGYGLPLVYEKTLDTSSITTDTKIMADSTSTVSYLDIIQNETTVYDTNAATMRYMNDSGNIVKVKVGYTSYEAGDIIQLTNGTKWYSISNSDMEEERINLVSYYGMSTRNYGFQDSTNPTLRFHYSQQNPAVYDANADIYHVTEATISATQVELVKDGINFNGSSVKMPEIEDFDCTVDVCRVYCFKGDGNLPFWTIDTEGEYVYTINSEGLGRANTESTGFGIRVVIKNLLKSNIDKKATKALN